MSILSKRARRGEVKPYAIGEPKVLWVREGAKCFSRESLVAHLSVEDGLLPGPLEPLQKASYYLALISPEKVKDRDKALVVRGVGRSRGRGHAKGRGTGRGRAKPSEKIHPIADKQDSDGDEPPDDDVNVPDAGGSPVEDMIPSDDTDAEHVDDDDTSAESVKSGEHVDVVDAPDDSGEEVVEPPPRAPVPPAPQDLGDEQDDDAPSFQRLRRGAPRRAVGLNDVVIFDELFVYLRRAGHHEPVGLSLPCKHHVGKGCARDVNFYSWSAGVPTRRVLTEEAAAKRLLAWESDVLDDDSKLITRKQHCRRMPPFLASYSWADELDPAEADT